MRSLSIAILHYSAPPIVGGVEAVIQAHAQVFASNGHAVHVIAGRGERSSLPSGCAFHKIPKIDSQHPQVVEISAMLERGEVPEDMDKLSDQLMQNLEPILADVDVLIGHNLFTKEFNLPLTNAIFRLLDEGKIRHCIAWCHDITWASPASRSKVRPGYPWDLIRTKHPDVTYVAVSKRRRAMLAKTFGCPKGEIKVVYNGVDPKTLYGISDEVEALIERLDLLDSDLIILMPVRVTRAKNIEHALRVVASLKSRECKPKLVLTGPPDPHSAKNMSYFRSLKALCSRLGIDAEMDFVYESGPNEDGGYTIDFPQVGDLMRVSDLVFIPSNREGFGMPILEAGLLGIPVMATEIPAAKEIGGEDVIFIDNSQDPSETADQIMAWCAENSEYRLRRRVRQHYTWESIYRRQIRPLLSSRDGDQ